MLCTSDKEKAQRLKSGQKMLEVLEKDMLPAILRMYFNQEDKQARALVRMMRMLWKTSLRKLKEVIMEIIDPVAYCVVLEQECRKIANKVDTVKLLTRWIQ